MDSDAPPRAGWAPLVLVCVTAFATVANSPALSISISKVIDDLDTTVARVQLAIVTYSLVLAAFTIVGGKLGSLIGLLPAQLTGLGVFGLGSLIAATAPSAVVLIIAEAVAGLGGAILIPNAIALLGRCYAGQQRTVALSIQAGILGVASAVALMVCGVLVQQVSWRANFVAIIVLLAIAAILCTRISVPPAATGTRARLDGWSIVLSSVGILLLVLSINQAGPWGLIAATPDAPVDVFGLSPVLPLMAAALLMFGRFLTRQRALAASARSPLLHPSIIETPMQRTCVWASIAINVLLGGFAYLLPLYTQIVLGKSPIDSSLIILPMSLVTFVSAALTPRLLRYASPLILLTSAHIVTAVATVLVAASMSSGSTTAATMVAEGFVGLGLGVGLSLGSALLVNSSPPSLAGDVGSLRGITTFVGAAAGTAVAGTVLLTVLAASATARLESSGIALGDQVYLEPSTIQFVSNDALSGIIVDQGWPLDEAEIAKVVDINVDARLDALRASLVLLAVITLIPLVWFRHLRQPQTASTGEPSPRPPP
jgi:MFS family permease